MASQPKAFAILTTPPGKGGIAVIVLSGPSAGEILARVFRPWKSHTADCESVLRLGHIVDDSTVIDEAVVCRRGELYEINIHGGPLVAQQTLELLVRHGAQRVATFERPAEVDLFEPAHPPWNNPAIGREMLQVLPLAQSPVVVAALTQQWSAGLSRLARELIEEPPERAHEADLVSAAAGLGTFRKLLHPAEVVVAGEPNVGKSTLVNALVGRAVSIVHDQPGTTRDWVRELALIGGVPIWLTDTAGLWDNAEGVDAEAVRRAHQRAAAADLVLLAQADQPTDLPEYLAARPTLRLATKCDVCPPRGRPDVVVSAHQGTGLKELRDAILLALGLADLDVSAPMAFTERQARLLESAAQAPGRGDAPKAAEALRILLEG